MNRPWLVLVGVKMPRKFDRDPNAVVAGSQWDQPNANRQMPVTDILDGKLPLSEGSYANQFD